MAAGRNPRRSIPQKASNNLTIVFGSGNRMVYANPNIESKRNEEEIEMKGGDCGHNIKNKKQIALDAAAYLSYNFVAAAYWG